MSGGCFFDNRMTVADFHKMSSTHSLSELLNIAVTGAARRCEQFFNTHGGMLSGPVALLTLTFSSTTSVSVTLVMNSSHTDTKNPFIELTRLSKSPSVYFMGQPLHLIAAAR